MKRLALGPLGLKPWEFWRLTQAELLDMLEGHKLKNEQEMERLAWQTANLMNVHLKRKVTIKQLLGKGAKRQTEDQKQAQLAKLQKEVGKIKERKD